MTYATTNPATGDVEARFDTIDDAALKNYRETVDPRSPNIVLFAPSGSQNPYYAEFGWVAASGIETTCTT